MIYLLQLQYFEHAPYLATTHDGSCLRLQLPLLHHIPCKSNRMQHRLLRHPPQMLIHIFSFPAAFLQVRIRPLKIERQIQIRLVLTLRDRIVDESPAVLVVEVHLLRISAVFSELN